MDNVKRTDIVFGAEHGVDERSAHVVDFFHEIGMCRKRAAMVVHAVNALILGMIGSAHAGENVHLMAFALQGTGQLGDVRRNASNHDRVQGFPREERYPHNRRFSLKTCEKEQKRKG
jgi:hypothetical protein